MQKNPSMELPEDLNLDEARLFVKLIVGFQNAWLNLVEHCHKPSLEATLECCRQIQSDAIIKLVPNTTVAESMNSALTTVLSRFYDPRKDITLRDLKEVFKEVGAELTAQLAECERHEEAQ